jgi:hypothetical protein
MTSGMAMVAKVGRAKIIAFGGIVLAVIIGATWSLSFPYREARRWSHCLSKKLSECVMPSDYVLLSDCPVYLDCRTKPAGVRYAYAVLDTHRGSL